MKIIFVLTITGLFLLSFNSVYGDQKKLCGVDETKVCCLGELRGPFKTKRWEMDENGKFFEKEVILKNWLKKSSQQCITKGSDMESRCTNLVNGVLKAPNYKHKVNIFVHSTAKHKLSRYGACYIKPPARAVPVDPNYEFKELERRKEMCRRQGRLDCHNMQIN